MADISRGRSPADVLKVGDKVEARVLKVDPKNAFHWDSSNFSRTRGTLWPISIKSASASKAV
jgi:hypothetical protein